MHNSSWSRFQVALLVLSIIMVVGVVIAVAASDSEAAMTGGTPYTKNNTGGMPYVSSSKETVAPAKAAANTIVRDGFRNRPFRGVNYPAAYVVRVNRAEGYGICASLTAYVPKRGGGWRMAPRTRKARDCANERTGFTRLPISNDLGRRYVKFLADRFGVVRWVGKYHYLSGDGTVEKGRFSVDVLSRTR